MPFQMKLFALLVMYKDDPPTRLKGAFDVSSFSFFQRSSVQGTLLFINRVLVSLGVVGTAQIVRRVNFVPLIFNQKSSIFSLERISKSAPTVLKS